MASNSHPFWQCMRGGHANVTITSISYHITHAYTRACICTCTPTRSHACAYVRACMQASLHTSRPTFTRGRVYTCLHVHTYTPPLALPGRGVLPSQAYDLLFRSQAVACMLLINPSCVGACGKIEKGRASTAWRVRSLLPLLLPLLLLQSSTTTSTTFAPAPPHSPLPPRSLTLHCPQPPHSPLPLTPRSLALIPLMLSPMGHAAPSLALDLPLSPSPCSPRPSFLSAPPCPRRRPSLRTPLSLLLPLRSLALPTPFPCSPLSPSPALTSYACPHPCLHLLPHCTHTPACTTHCPRPRRPPSTSSLAAAAPRLPVCCKQPRRRSDEARRPTGGRTHAPHPNLGLVVNE